MDYKLWIEKELVNSGKVEFVASSSERQSLRNERLDQAEHSSEETQKGPGQETGADFALKGQINSIVDRAGGESVVFYQIELELIHIGSNKKVWIAQKKIKKLLNQDSVSL